jgi:hypothetical protein
MSSPRPEPFLQTQHLLLNGRPYLNFVNSLRSVFARFGENTYDIFLNDVAYWKNVPSRVWNYIIGGHQILKKWLSYREYKVIERSINPDEAREFMNISRRIAAILLLETALDDNYKKIKKNAYVWSK